MYLIDEERDEATDEHPEAAREQTEQAEAVRTAILSLPPRYRAVIEFKDQAQNMISTNEGLVTLTTSWQKFTTTAVAPPGTWSVSVVLVAERRDYVSFDDVQMTWR